MAASDEERVHGLVELRHVRYIVQDDQRLVQFLHLHLLGRLGDLAERGVQDPHLEGFFLFSAFACEDFCSFPRGSRRGAPAPHAAESRSRPAPRHPQLRWILLTAMLRVPLCAALVRRSSLRYFDASR